MEERDFAWAIRQLKAGEKVQRTGWNGKGMYLFLMEDWGVASDVAGDAELFPFIAMKTAQDTIVPWLASQTDMLSSDWEPYQ